MTSRSTERGFSMVEMSIALAIVMLLVGISIPVLDNITRAELRAAASKTSGMVKATYDTAVLNGQPARLVFDFEKRTITAEVGSGKVTIVDKDSPERSRADEENDSPNDKDMNKLVAMAKRDVAAQTSVKRAATWSRAPGTVPFEIGSGVKVADVTAEHMKDTQSEGKAVIHFFPMGYCEHALIHFEDEAGRVYAVEIEPLTGRTRIFDKRIEYKEPK